MAQQVRTGLVENRPHNPIVVETRDSLSELWHNKTLRVHVREFGCVIACVALIISAVLIGREKHPTLAGGLIFFALLFWSAAVYAPRLMLPVWRVWMKLAEALGLIMTHILLTGIWIILMIPVALLLKIVGIKVMDRTFRAKVDSYWEKRNPKQNDFKLLTRQF